MEKKNTRKQLYHLYLKSGEWEEKRQLVLKRENGKCQSCSSTTSLCIHHWTYVRLFKEELSDLYCLCNDCHTRLHLPYGTKDLLRVTKAFIKGETYIPPIKKDKAASSTKEKIKAHNQLKRWKKNKKERKTKTVFTQKVRVKKRMVLKEDSINDTSFKWTVVLKKWKLWDPR